LSTRHDPQGRTTVYDLLPAGMQTLFTVGRLDADSEGLLLLTNDGDAANRMLHPRYGTEREYEVAVRGAVGDAALASLEAGVVLEDGPARVERVKRLPSREHGASRLRLVLKEGRKHEVRRLLEAVGHPVVRLRRIRYGPIKLGVLPIGEWRPLTEREMESLHVDQRIDPEDDVVRRETGARRERLTDERKGREWRSGSGES
jgi:23S rRNA pseudouridine2605 synthase